MSWLDDGRHGNMEWMETRAHQRIAPTALWPDARSAIALGMSYAPEGDPLALAGDGSVGRVSVYAQGGDYHKTVKKALKALARWLVERAGGELKVFVDTAPVMEKPLSAACGNRLAGKAYEPRLARARKLACSSVSSSPASSWSLTEPARDTCGSCTRCLDACPTQAFDGPGRIDARKCISYLTIEHSGPIPDEYRRAIGNRIYGCDDCLAVCPWNRFAQAASANRAFLPREELKAPKLQDLLALDDATFRALFAGSPIKRIGVKRMIRNCLIAAGNSRDPGLIAAVRPHLAIAIPSFPKPPNGRCTSFRAPRASRCTAPDRRRRARGRECRHK
jgi:epoxyqueuosine reductase